MSDAIIRVSHLSYRYPSTTAQRFALDDVSLEIPRGACVAVIGVNGSGKSTLVQHFNGLLRPSSGTVWVDGLDVGKQSGDLRQLRQRVGLLFQFPESQLFEKTVFADVAFGLQCMRLDRAEIRRRVAVALETVGLPLASYGSRSPFDLSGGQRRRVALAGIMAMRPTVLILDEPSVGLDAEGRTEFATYLKRIQREQGVTIILVSHDMSEVATLAERAFVFHSGRLVMEDTPQVLFAQHDALHSWGLTVPLLHELLALLRQRGLSIPLQVNTVDEVFEYLISSRSIR